MTLRMHNPPHPGEVLRELCFEPLGISVTDAAKALGVSRKTLSSILNGRAGISPEMAVRLSIAFDTSAESWLNQQIQYDLWQAEKRRKSRRDVGAFSVWISCEALMAWLLPVDSACAARSVSNAAPPGRWVRATRITYGSKTLRSVGRARIPPPGRNR